jgi:hypothetical protein
VNTHTLSKAAAEDVIRVVMELVDHATIIHEANKQEDRLPDKKVTDAKFHEVKWLLVQDHLRVIGNRDMYKANITYSDMTYILIAWLNRITDLLKNSETAAAELD